MLQPRLDLLERDPRSPAEDEEMVHAAHASRHHWGEVGAPVNWARGEWQLARVYTVLGRAEPALRHARRCLELAEEHELGDFDRGYAYEALARAHALAGDAAESARALALAREAAAGVADAEDRELLLADLDTI